MMSSSEEVRSDDDRHYVSFECGTSVMWTKGRCADQTLPVMKLPPDS